MALHVATCANALFEDYFAVAVGSAAALLEDEGEELWLTAFRLTLLDLRVGVDCRRSFNGLLSTGAAFRLLID